MKDKKQIIIDGVNIRKCRYFCIYDETCRDENIGHIVRPACKNVPDCYFKQLARRTQECEKYEQALNEIEEFIITDTCEPCKELEEDNCDECNGRIILDIINKAKDGE